MDGATKSALQDHVRERRAFRAGLTGRQRGPGRSRIAELLEPLERGLLDDGFVQGHGVVAAYRLVGTAA